MYVVAGFFTPNYEDIAKRFAHNLDAHSVPHKLYPVETLGGTWLAQTLRKPQIALRALDEHPGKSVILSDVDCTVHGDLAPLLVGDCDVALLIYTRTKHGRFLASTSSRVVVFHQTPGARALLAAWEQKCSAAIREVVTGQTKQRSWERSLGVGNDEHFLMEAIAATPNVVIRMLPPHHSGNANEQFEGPLITHDSAHDRHQPFRVVKMLKRWRRTLSEPYLQWRHGPDSGSLT